MKTKCFLATIFDLSRMNYQFIVLFFFQKINKRKMRGKRHYYYPEYFVENKGQESTKKMSLTDIHVVFVSR